MPETPGEAARATGPARGRWGDLTVRLASAVVLAALALGALWAGPGAWVALVGLAAALMYWELAGLCEPGVAGPRRWLPALGPLAIWPLYLYSGHWPLALAGPGWALALGLVTLRRGRLVWLGYGLVLALGALSLILLGLAGPGHVLALVAVVALSDTAGYFAGRALGGPKFWPRISPKKTWSGTVAGWLAAAAFGAWAGPALFGAGAGTGALVAALLALAGQMGDIAESALKRRVGVKDASALIPGHGGFLDRFDALIVAAPLAAALVVLYPGDA